MTATKRTPRKKTPKKTSSATLNSEKANTPAALTRAGLLADIPDAEIKAAVSERFPDYKALDICVTVYRRELRKQGLLK